MNLEAHNERLVLEKATLRQQLAGLEAHTARLVGLLMGDAGERTFTVDEWEAADGFQVLSQPAEDGGRIVQVNKQEDTDA